MALPLAPPDRFDEGLGLLANFADEIEEEHPEVLQFLSYLRRQWRPLADVVSVYNCPHRTNNLVESFHNEGKRKLGGLHPNIWKFIEHLTELILNQEIDLVRLLNGDRPRRPRTIRNMSRDTLIRDAQHDLRVGRFTLLEFLQRCATRTSGRMAHLRDEPYNEDDDLDEIALAPPGLLAAGEPRVEPVLRVEGRGRGIRGRGVRGRGVPGRGRALGVAIPADAQLEEEPAAAVEDARRSRSPLQADAEPELAAAVEGLPNEGDYEVPEDDYGYWFAGGARPEVPWDILFAAIQPVPTDAPSNNETFRPLDTCAVCVDDISTHMFLPCAHFCCCKSCLEQLVTPRCPLYNVEYASVVHVRRT